MRVDTGFLIGCDLGQSADPTAVVIAQRWEERQYFDRQGRALSAELVEALSPQRRAQLGGRLEARPSYDLVHIERVPLGTPYPKVERILSDLLQRPELAVGRFRGVDGPIDGSNRQSPELVVDGTGVGAAVLDHLRTAGLSPVGIMIHGGDTVTRAPYVHRVPKRDLVGVVSVRLQNQTLRITQTSPYAKVLMEELLRFRVKIDPVTAHDSYSAWREGGDHDDLVLATAIALWWGDRRPLPDGAYTVMRASS